LIIWFDDFVVSTINGIFTFHTMYFWKNENVSYVLVYFGSFILKFREIQMIFFRNF